jgi:hypothetical protein
MYILLMVDYEKKYLKYKAKYLKLKKQSGGINFKETKDKFEKAITEKKDSAKKSIVSAKDTVSSAVSSSITRVKGVASSGIAKLTDLTKKVKEILPNIPNIDTAKIITKIQSVKDINMSDVFKSFDYLKNLSSDSLITIKNNIVNFFKNTNFGPNPESPIEMMMFIICIAIIFMPFIAAGAAIETAATETYNKAYELYKKIIPDKKASESLIEKPIP